MKHLIRKLFLLAVALVAPTALLAQAPDQPKADKESPVRQELVPKLEFGNIPDISGAYLVSNFRPSVAAMDPDLKSQDPPFLPGEAGKYHSSVAGRKPGNDDSPSSRCLPPGISFLMTMPYTMEVIQLPGRVLTFHEFENSVRQIWTDGRGHGDPDPSWMGHSIGRYEGDTLVVDTVGFNGKGWLDLTGLKASDALHTVERFRKNGSDLEYSMTIEDPKTFSRPWTIRANFKSKPGWVINEFVCLDNNKLMGSPGLKEPAKP